MGGERFGLGKALTSRRARLRNPLFGFLRKRCRVCHRPPDVLYYDSPQFGFLCSACHTDAMEKRMAAIRVKKLAAGR
jgi:hypothetical protein